MVHRILSLNFVNCNKMPDLFVRKLGSIPSKSNTRKQPWEQLAFNPYAFQCRDSTTKPTLRTNMVITALNPTALNSVARPSELLHIRMTALTLSVSTPFALFESLFSRLNLIFKAAIRKQAWRLCSNCDVQKKIQNISRRHLDLRMSARPNAELQTLQNGAPSA
jgi:hypothetical protein